MFVQPRITFAIPYYRGLEYLEKALRSLQEQSNPNWVAIVVDDRGGEDAEETVASFEDQRISYIRNDRNLGLAGNWNVALSYSSTEFVTIFHSDDELEINYVDLMLDIMERHTDAVAGHCRTRVIGPDGEPLWSLPDEVKKIIRPRSKQDIITAGQQGLLSITKGAWIFCPALCYRRALLPAGGFSSQWKFVLDVDLMARILFSGGKIVGTPEVGYRYRRHLTNQTALLTESSVRFQEEFDHLNGVAERARELGWKKVEKSARRKTIVRLHLLYQALRAVVEMKWDRVKPLAVGALTGHLK
jgi:glycosyltransferase involved in cell wall biosynthesis